MMRVHPVLATNLAGTAARKDLRPSPPWYTIGHD